MIISSIQIARDMGFGGPTPEFYAWMTSAGFTEKRHCGYLPGYYPSEVQAALRHRPIIGPGLWRAA